MIIGFVAVGVICIMLGDSDDRPGGFALGIMIAFPSLIITAAAAVFERQWAKRLPQ